MLDKSRKSHENHDYVLLVKREYTSTTSRIAYLCSYTIDSTDMTPSVEQMTLRIGSRDLIGGIE